METQEEYEMKCKEAESWFQRTMKQLKKLPDGSTDNVVITNEKVK